MTNSPNIVNVFAVSTTTSPVTQVADVEVNKAFKNERPFPSTVAMGRVDNNAPIRITVAKPNRRTFGGLGLPFTLFIVTS